MRKTRNFLRRAGSAALALTLTVSRPKTPIKDQKATGDTSASAGDSSAQGEKEVTQVEYKEIGEVTVKLVDQRSLS